MQAGQISKEYIRCARGKLKDSPLWLFAEALTIKNATQ
jgi:hypothetical protein